jgi:ubiquinone/menaquinone biosynthesis C-methylase UbiE
MNGALKFAVFAVALALLVHLGERYYGVVSRTILCGHAIKTLAMLDSADYSAFVNSYDVFDNPKHTDEDETKVNAVYKVLVPLMELGHLTKFYIPPLMDPSRASFRDMGWNQELFERKMADEMKLAPGKVALDVGCGQGLVADMVQDQSGARVVGINISPEQIAKARSNAAAKNKLGAVLDFKMGSFNDPLDFPDNSFDAAYVVQASCYAHDFTKFMSEIARVLKPGGIFSDMAVATLDGYDLDNETQVKMAGEAKRVGVIPVWRPAQYYLDGCTNNGMKVTMKQHLGHHEMMQAATDFFNPLGGFIGALNYVGIVSDQLVASIDRMNEHAQALIQGDKMGLFTTNYWFTCEKPAM